MELLQKERVALEIRSELLINSLENTLEYSKENLGSILRVSVMEAVLPTLPSFVQRMIFPKETSTRSRENNQFTAGPVGFLAEGVLSILPFLLKGKKGIIVAFILKKLKDKFLK